MDPVVITRLAYEGCDPSDTWKVVGIGHSKLNMEKVDIVNVDTISEYEAGCQIHNRCSGHLCKTPHGLLLPMQSLCVSTPVVKNDIYKAARAAFSGSAQYNVNQHRTILLDSMKAKTGRMRKGILNCHVDGSLRMIITPQTTLAFNTVAIPMYLSKIWTVVYFDQDTNRYKKRLVSDGDCAIAVRPPSLSIKSVQPVKITFWNETCMGISPDVLKAFSGDYDGDEMHLYPVYSEESLMECNNWFNTPNKTFEKAREIYAKSNIPNKKDDPYSFMMHSTMSFEEIRNNKEQPLFAEQTRTTKEHLSGFRSRYNVQATGDTFVDEAIRGMADTNAQQLSQPIVGDMSRIARLAASCVVHRPDGIIGIAAGTVFIPVTMSSHDIQDGSSSMRGISIICAGVQQILLESHHAKKRDLPAHDIVSDMIIGASQTLVIFDSKLSETQIHASVRPKWCDKQINATYVLCSPTRLKSIPKVHIKGSYNPAVLSLVATDRRLEVCRYGIEQVMKYYSFALSDIEILCLAVLFSHNCEASTDPITTKQGMEARNLRWIETMMANNYSKFIKTAGSKTIDISSLDTISACLMAGNLLSNS